MLSCVVALLGIIVASMPLLIPSIERIFGTYVFSPEEEVADFSFRSAGYHKTPKVSGAQMTDLEIPLVTVTQPPIAKRWSELAHGSIKITSDWEIHSSRNSARIEQDSIRRGFYVPSGLK